MAERVRLSPEALLAKQMDELSAAIAKWESPGDGEWLDPKNAKGKLRAVPVSPLAMKPDGTMNIG